jgi:opacity protein-like surface antigen
MHHSKILVCALALLGLSSAPALVSAPAAAEGFLDLYMGASFPENGDVDARASSPSIFAASINDRIEYDTSFTGGLRGGYWFEDAANFIGIGLDLSYYGAFEDTSTAPLDIYALPITPLLMARIPIAVEEDFPGGRVQPYGAIGPGFTLSVALADLSELGIGIDDLADASFDLGLDVRGGLAIHVAKPIALFAEYRYTRLRPEYDDEVDFDFGPDIDIDIEPDLDVHHLVFGVSFRF